MFEQELPQSDTRDHGDLPGRPMTCPPPTRIVYGPSQCEIAPSSFPTLAGLEPSGPKEAHMHTHQRTLGLPKLAAGFFVTLTLLSAACSKDPASSINSPAILSSSSISSFVAASAPSLGTSANFAALGGTGVTCTTPNPPLPAVTVSGGDVGSGSAVPATGTGFPGFGASLCSLSGTVRLGATAAITDMILAYNALRDNNTCPRPAAPAGHTLVGLLTPGSQGSTLEPGVYCITGAGLLTSQLTLNGGGNSNAVWIFKAASDLTPKNGSVVMANGGNAG